MKKNKRNYVKRLLSLALSMLLILNGFVLPVQAEEPADIEPVVSIAEDEGDVATGGSDISIVEDTMSSDEEPVIEDIEMEAGSELVLEDGEAESVPELAGTGTAQDPYVIIDATQLPTEITADTYYVLGADITLASNQQIGTLAGTLDGKGHVITLSGTSLAYTVSGVIQNLGVTGNVSGGDDTGAVAMILTGKICNSYSTVSVAAAGMFNDIGGLVGTVNGGTVKNSYYAGNITTTIFSGFVGVINQGSTFTDCYYTTDSFFGTAASRDYTKERCEKKTLAQFREESILDTLNNDIEDTGYHFALMGDDSLPYLTDGKIAINWKSLERAIASAQEKTVRKDEYTSETWAEVEKALANAQKIYNEQSESVTQQEINAAAKTLNDAVAALKKKPVTVPVAADGKNVITVSSQSDLDYNKFTDPNNYFILENDITINSGYSWRAEYTDFYGVLDGQGHTITMDGSTPVFQNAAEGSVIQNVVFKGKINAYSTVGPLGSQIKGALINSYSEVEGSSVCGFAGTLSDTGVISNCFSIGEAKKGAFVSANNGGTVLNAYYAKDYASSVIGTGMSEGEMKTPDFVSQLNKNRGEYGTKWGQSSGGYPYFGVNQEYTPDDPDAYPEPGEESLYQAAFRPYDSEAAQNLEENKLQVSPQCVDSYGIAGTLSLVSYDAPENTKVVWDFTYTKPKNVFERNYDTGELYVKGTGKAVISATEVNVEDESPIRTLAYVSILSVPSEMQDIRLYIDGTDVTNRSCSVAGSEQKWINVKAKLADSEEYEDVAYTGFTYEVDNPEVVFLRSSASNCFYFKKPGNATITVTSKQNQDLKAYIELTSEYVPIQSVKPALSQDVYMIHGRNANSEGQEADGRIAYNPIHDNVIVTPANATNADRVTVNSNNDKIAYYESGEKVYVPKEAGTVTFTASAEDQDPYTGEINTVTGSRTVTFRYLNPLVSVEIENANEGLKVGSGEVATIQVNVTGEKEDYHVTEPALNWTVDQQGIVKIISQAKGRFDRDENSPDYNMYFPEMTYTVVGLSEGTVTATGTPVDTTNEVEPVTVTITVEGEAEKTDIDTLVSVRSGKAHDYVAETYGTDGYVYGDEWLVYAELRAGKTMDQAVLDAYYASVAAKVSTWNENQKATDLERVALALTVMDRDITNVDGINLASMIYNHPALSSGSNELIYALLALDAADIDIPADAKWSRSAMISELLKYQNVSSGGFGLLDSKSTSVDVTAMALQSLANYQNRPEVETAVDKALEYLRSQQQDDYGYGNAESTAQVLIALSLLGIDPTLAASGFGMANFNIITNLMEYQNSDGGFAHLKGWESGSISTAQALHALDAYQQSKNGIFYWSVNGVKLEVAFALLGDSVHNSDADGNTHTLLAGNLQTWISETIYRVKKGASVKDLVDMALKANDMTCETEYNGTYISAIIKGGVRLGEFTNGKNSGWMYSLNGAYSEFGVTQQKLDAGDVVVFYYTDNWAKEYPHEHSWAVKWSNNSVYHWHECNGTGADCDAVQNSQKNGYGAHTFGRWKTSSKATVFAAEKQKRTCSVCGYSQTKSIGKALKPVLEVPGRLSSFQIKKGQTRTVTLTMAAGDSLKSVKSSNTKYVKVVSYNKKDGTMKLKAVNSGTSKITIRLASGKTRTYNVKAVTETVKTTKITVSSKKLTLSKGKTKTLRPILTPFTSSQKITYKSSNTKVATVTSKGIIKAVAPGIARITVTSGSKKTTVTVTVPGIGNVKSSVAIKKGKTLILKPQTYGIKGTVTYKSSNTKVVTVTSKGKVKGVGKGTAVITVKAGSYSVKCKVKVG